MPGANSLLGSASVGITLPGTGGGGGGGGVSFGLLIDDVTQITAPPADTKIRFNNTTHNLATKLFVDGTATDSTDIEAALTKIGEATAYVIIRSTVNADRWLWARITQTTDQAGYVEYDIDVKDSEGGSFDTDEDVTFGFDLAFDDTAIHNNKAGEINAIADKALPVGADVILLEDSADGFNKKKSSLGNLPVNAHAFAGSQHTSSTISDIQTKASDGSFFTTESGEVNALTAKGSPVAGDFVIIEDSADSFNKKKVDVSVLGGGLQSPLSQSGDCLQNVNDNGEICFLPGSAIARGKIRIVDSQNPTRGMGIEVINNSIIFDGLDVLANSGYAFRHQGTTLFDMDVTSVRSHRKLNPNVDLTYSLGENSFRWTSVATAEVSNGIDGADLTLVAGGGNNRGKVVIPDSQGDGDPLNIFYDSGLSAWETFTDDSIVHRFGDGGSYVIGNRSGGGSDQELLKVTKATFTTIELGANGTGLAIYANTNNPMIFGRSGAEYVFYDTVSKAWCPSSNAGFSLGKGNLRWENIHMQNLVNESSGISLGTINVTAGSASSRGWLQVIDPESELRPRKLNNAVSSTVTNNDEHEWCDTIGSSARIDATNAISTEILHNAANHKIKPIEVMVECLSGTWTSDVSVSLGTTGDLTKYYNNQPLFGATPTAGDVVTILISDRSNIDDLFLTVNGAATGTDPILRTFSRVLRTENE